MPKIESTVLLMELLTVTLNAAYIDAEVNDYTGANCWPGQTLAQGCTGDYQNIDGGELPSAPQWKYGLFLEYEHDLDGVPFDAFAGFNYSWQDDVIFDINQDPDLYQDAYGIANLRVGIVDDDSHYQVAAFVNNLFDEQYASGMRNGSLLYDGAPAYSQMLARNAFRYWGLTAKYQFGERDRVRHWLLMPGSGGCHRRGSRRSIARRGQASATRCRSTTRVSAAPVTPTSSPPDSARGKLALSPSGVCSRAHTRKPSRHVPRTCSREPAGKCSLPNEAERILSHGARRRVASTRGRHGDGRRRPAFIAGRRLVAERKAETPDRRITPVPEPPHQLVFEARGGECIVGPEMLRVNEAVGHVGAPHGRDEARAKIEDAGDGCVRVRMRGQLFGKLYRGRMQFHDSPVLIGLANVVERDSPERGLPSLRLAGP